MSMTEQESQNAVPCAIIPVTFRSSVKLKGEGQHDDQNYPALQVATALQH
jgi:hypothetical protein